MFRASTSAKAECNCNYWLVNRLADSGHRVSCSCNTSSRVSAQHDEVCELLADRRSVPAADDSACARSIHAWRHRDLLCRPQNLFVFGQRCWPCKRAWHETCVQLHGRDGDKRISHSNRVWLREHVCEHIYVSADAARHLCGSCMRYWLILGRETF